MPNNNPRGGQQWLPDHLAELTTRLSEGMVYSKIAVTLNGKFGTSYSRNAVAGQIHRLGLVGPERPKTERKPRVRTEAQKAARKLAGYRRTTHNSNSMRRVEAIKMAALRCVEIEPQHVSLADRTGCCYPYGDGPFTFCNHDKLDGSSYCPSHHLLCWIPPRVLTDRAPAREAA